MSSFGFELTTQEKPSPEEARKLWQEGKTLKDWLEERRQEKKRKRREK